MAKKSVTVKLEKDMLEDVDNECQGLGCNRTDFVTEAVQEKLEGKNEEPKPNEEPKIVKGEIISNNKSVVEEPKEFIPKRTTGEIIEVRMHEEPKQIDNSNKPPIPMIWYDGKLLPYTKRFDI